MRKNKFKIESSQSAMWRRRDVLRSGAKVAAAVTVASALPHRVAHALGVHSPFAHTTGAETTNQRADTERMQKLVLRAIDAARSAGAQYAEARVTRTVGQAVYIQRSPLDLEDSEGLSFGVRALVNGAWGFAASSYWELDEADVLARSAVEQAKINASIFQHAVELGTYPVAKGSWVTPIRIDPFQISPEEKLDFFRSFDGLLPRRVPKRSIKLLLSQKADFGRQERMVASTENSLFGQTLYRSGAGLGIGVSVPPRGDYQASAMGKGIGLAGAGWELFLDAKLREQIPGLIEEAEANLFRPHKPVDVGRYEVVMSAGVLASFVASTLGDATQLDRAVGMEANAGGTSYLGPDPVDYLGTTLGSSLLTVTANRSMPKGLATVKWDDEGVEPDDFSIIERGVVVDYQTTREQAAWLAPWYQSKQRPVRSHGCVVAPEASYYPLQHTPNLVVAPGTGTATFDEMIQQTPKGIAFLSGWTETDFQSRNGQAEGVMREIVDGKLGAVLVGASVLFDSTKFWKNLLELGGPRSRDVSVSGSLKGQPLQSSSYSIHAVPGRFKELAVVDVLRK